MRAGGQRRRAGNAGVVLSVPPCPLSGTRGRRGMLIALAAGCRGPTASPRLAVAQGFQFLESGGGEGALKQRVLGMISNRASDRWRLREIP